MTVLLVTHSVEEALILANRIIVLNPRSGRVRKVVEVPGPQGSGRLQSLDVMRIQRQIWDLLKSKTSRRGDRLGECQELGATGYRMIHIQGVTTASPENGSGTRSMVVIDADGHVMETAAMWAALDKRYETWRPRWVRDPEGVMRVLMEGRPYQKPHGPGRTRPHFPLRGCSQWPAFCVRGLWNGFPG